MRDAFKKQIAALKFKPKRKLVLVPKKAPATSGLPPEILAFAEQNFKLFPVKVRDKTPLIKGWPSLATNEVAQLEKWARQFPNCNWGAKTGDGIVVLDVDGLAGRMAIRAWEAAGLLLPSTRTHSTGKGQHLLFTTTAPVRNSAGKLAPGLDVRGEVGYVVVPPSVHPSGAPYETANGAPIALLPDWLYKKMLATVSGTRAAAGEIPEGERDDALASIAGTLRHAGKTRDEIEAALTALNAEQCEPPKPEEDVSRIAKSIARYPVPDNVTALLNDTERVRVTLPTDNRLLGDFAAELGVHLRGLLYRHGRDAVIVEGNALRVISAQELRTLAEQRVICCRVRSTRGGAVDVGVTMSAEEARGALVSPQFLAALDSIKTVTSCRVPVMRGDGSIELLPLGYDPESRTMTLAGCEYRDDLAFDEALDVLRNLFGEFEFADAERSLAVAVSALVGLYAQQLPPAGALRPVFVYTKNAEGSGATTAAACAVVPVLGNLPTGSQPCDGEEMRKLLTSSLREGQHVLLLDNVKGILGGAALEAFCSAATWCDRVLGANELVTLENSITVFATANGATLTPDMRRRSLVCELHLSVERAEDRRFKRPLNVAVLKSMRLQILAACWALVRSWGEQGRPEPSRSHSAFPEWAATIAGIVESAGFGCPLATPKTMFAPDEDGDAMRSLVAAMKPGRPYDATQLYALCRANQIFTTLVGLHESDMGKAQLSTMGRLLARYHNRLVGKSRFLIAGTGHGRRFFAKNDSPDQHGRMVEHGVSPELLKTHVFDLKGKHHADHADHVAPSHRRSLEKAGGKLPCLSPGRNELRKEHTNENHFDQANKRAQPEAVVAQWQGR